MAHYRKPLAAAVALNTAIFVVEAIAGFQSESLSLIMDSVHNLSDELALVFLYLAFVLPLVLGKAGISRTRKPPTTARACVNDVRSHCHCVLTWENGGRLF